MNISVFFWYKSFKVTYFGPLPWFFLYTDFDDSGGREHLTLILGGLGPPLIENSVFRQETVEERLDLTSYMSYMDAEGRGWLWPTALSIRIAHMAR